MGESDHEIWRGVSEERIERSKEYFDRTARLAWSYSCSILIGCPRMSTEDASSGTGVFLRIDDNYFVLTARHVVAEYEDRLAEKRHTHFQIGQLEICPLCRMVYDDATNDLAVLAIAPTEVAQVGSTPYLANEHRLRPSLKVGQHIQFCGYARINRVDGAAGEINSTVLPLIGEISNCDDTHFSVVGEREKYRWNGDCLLRPDQKFLGGMSGGPALLLNDPSFPLIGVVPFTLSIVQAINDWQRGGDRKQKQRRGRKLKEECTQLPTQFSSATLACFRQIALLKDSVWNLMADEEINESISAWTINLAIAKEFKGGVPPEGQGYQGVTFCRDPKTANVVVNLVEVYRDKQISAGDLRYAQSDRWIRRRHRRIC